MANRGTMLLLAILTLGAALPAAAGRGAADWPRLFATSDRCLACHNGLVTPRGEDASIGSAWQPSMMANASRDPYWQASVRRETLDHPTAAAAIEHECAKCHMPMARYLAHTEGRTQPVFGELPGAAPATTHPVRLAADGVSCGTCHQITPQGLGEEASFSGGFKVDEERAWDERRMFGPYSIEPGLTRVMHSASGFEPAEADHAGSSELCATCHTLITHSLGPDGRVIGELPEQVPYLEWRHGAYAGVRDCISCHMPEVSEPVAIASVLGEPREEVSRHVFRGGNFLLPRIFSEFGKELGVTASPAQLEQAALHTLQHLNEEAASVGVKVVEIVDSTLVVDVVVESYAGHKLPTAYPSRRAWLHLAVADAGGQAVFESGALIDSGAITGNDNDADPSRFEPHYREIDRPDQVQIYETILGEQDGSVTTGLLSAVRYLKDNRIPPEGFDKTTAEERIAVRGRAGDDTDFQGGSDRIRYRIDVTGAAAPFEVQAELLYQPIGYRWADNLRDSAAAEGKRFVCQYEALSHRSAAVLARDAARSR